MVYAVDMSRTYDCRGGSSDAVADVSQEVEQYNGYDLGGGMMGIKNYIELAKRSIKEHKRSTVSSILGVAFGFVFVIPIFILLFNIRVTIDRQLNQLPYAVYAEISMADHRLDLEDKKFEYGTVVSGKRHLQEILDEKKITSSIVYESIALRDYNNKLPLSCYVNGEEKVNKTLQSEESGFISIINTSKSDSIFPKNLEDNFEGGIFADGMDGGFSGDGKKQIIVSERFLDYLGLSAQDVYMQNLSLRSTEKVDVRAGADQPIELKELTAYYFKDYKVVGVIKDQVTQLYDRSNRDYMASDIFVTDNNVYDESGKGVLKPQLEGYKYYTDITDFDQKNQEYMYPGFYWGVTNEGSHFSNNNGKYCTTRVYFEGDSYADLRDAVDSISAKIISSVGVYFEVVRTSEVVSAYKSISYLADMISGILIAIGLVMATCAFVNQYATMKFSVDKRKYFLTMMRAVGAKDDSVVKLYGAEAGVISGIASAIFLVFGFIALVVTKIFVAKMMGYLATKGMTGFSVGISWSSIFIGLLIGAAVLIGITLLLAYCSSYALSKKKITDVLNNE